MEQTADLGCQNENEGPLFEMNCVISSSSNRRGFVTPCLVLVQLVFAAATFSAAQPAQKWTERRNLGFEGPVQSVLTTVARPNPDPRPDGRRKLAIEVMPDWAVFDTQGRRTEFVSAFSRDRFEAISKCAFEADGTKVCTDGAGHRQESRQQEATLADGSRELTYFLDSKIQSRDVTRLDEEGRPVASRNYDGNGRLMSEDSTVHDGDDETTIWKIYDESGHVASNEQTRVSEKRIDRWSYDPGGRLVWHLAVDGDGEVLSYWYDVGYKPKLSSSDSLGICRPRLCVSYKFDEQGSGLMEKSVQHISGQGNSQPDGEEHDGFDGLLDEKAEFKYVRDHHGNWTSRSALVWDAASNQMIEVERDTRTIEYF